MQGVRLEDEGFFVCSAFSVAGSLATKAYLEVTAVGNEPPPIIRVGRSGYLVPVDGADVKGSLPPKKYIFLGLCPKLWVGGSQES